VLDGNHDVFRRRFWLRQAFQEALGVDVAMALKRKEAEGQFDLFGGDGGACATAESSPLAHLKFEPQEYPRKQLLAYEREMPGLYVSAHPLDGTERILRKHAP